MSDQEIYDLKRRVADLERRLGDLDGGGRAAPAPQADPEVVRLLRDGNTIAAIKRYRELTGAGLAEAKAAVEALAP